MAPPLLQLTDIALTFGGTPLLDGVELSVSAGERVCLVGRNGSGKSTLLKIAAGLIEPDRGTRFVQPGATVRYLPQEPDFAGHATTLAYVRGRARRRATTRIRRATCSSSSASPARKIPRSLSGGEARRAALAHVLAPQPDILLLDEPTNHLDLPAIEWLEARLASQRGALVLISHDRRFLREPVARHRLARPRRRRARVELGFGAFEAWRDEKLAEEERRPAQARPQDRARGALGALRRDRAAQAQRAPHGGAAGACGRRGASYRGSHGQGGDRGGAGGQVGRARHRGQGASPRRSARARSSTDFSTRIMRGDRIGIVGPNGSGKTTLVSLLTGALRARQRRRSGSAPTCEMATLEQGRDSLDPNWTLTRGADRRARRHGRRSAASAKHVVELHEGLPVRARAGAHAAARALGRRARPPDAGARAGQALERAGARRADQRPRSRNARRAGGDARRLCRHRHPDQPRPRLSRPRRARA